MIKRRIISFQLPTCPGVYFPISHPKILLSLHLSFEEFQSIHVYKGYAYKKSVLKVFSAHVHKFQKTTDQVTFTKYSLKTIFNQCSTSMPPVIIRKPEVFFVQWQ